MWGADQNHVWAVGYGIYTWNGSSWNQQTIAGANDLRGVWQADADNIWAVGKAGTILKKTNGAWVPQESGSQNDLFGIWGTDADNVWSVGDKGTILRWDCVASAQLRL